MQSTELLMLGDGPCDSEDGHRVVVRSRTSPPRGIPTLSCQTWNQPRQQVNGAVNISQWPIMAL